MYFLAPIAIPLGASHKRFCELAGIYLSPRALIKGHNQPRQVLLTSLPQLIGSIAPISAVCCASPHLFAYDRVFCWYFGWYWKSARPKDCNQTSGLGIL